jgi:hypothetical protein
MNTTTAGEQDCGWFMMKDITVHVLRTFTETKKICHDSVDAVDEVQNISESRLAAMQVRNINQTANCYNGGSSSHLVQF